MEDMRPGRTEGYLKQISTQCHKTNLRSVLGGLNVGFRPEKCNKAVHAWFLISVPAQDTDIWTMTL